MNGTFQNLSPCGLAVRTSDGRNCILQEPLEYLSLSGLPLRVPVFSPTDGRSSPRGTWNLVPPFGRGWFAWVFHDGCYKDLVEIRCADGQWRPFHPTKEQSDDLLHEIMEQLGCDSWEIRATFDAVEKCGQASFDEDRKIAAAAAANDQSPSLMGRDSSKITQCADDPRHLEQVAHNSPPSTIH